MPLFLYGENHLNHGAKARLAANAEAVHVVVHQLQSFVRIEHADVLCSLFVRIQPVPDFRQRFGRNADAVIDDGDAQLLIPADQLYLDHSRPFFFFYAVVDAILQQRLKEQLHRVQLRNFFIIFENYIELILISLLLNIDIAD
ncbi:hypothetical protein D3C77_395950 [compost metagenome]